MRIDDVHRGVHRNRKPKRLGRGPGSGHGKTASRGHKGQRSRAGHSMRPIFEGGQMPLIRRIPKRGFHNPFAPKVAEVNVADLERWFNDGDEVSPDTLRAAGRVRGAYDVLKILGNGALTKKLKVSAHRFSKSAEEKIKAAGGETAVLPGPAPVAKNSKKDQNSSQ